LLGGMALTASELALEAGVSLPTASSHLAKLSAGGLVTVAVQGRHRYYALSGPRVASMLEAISVVASSDGPQRVRPGPRDAALRHARVCYDHLAGGMLREAIRMEKDGRTLELTPTGESFFRGWGLDPASVPRGRRPLCRSCLDWSVRRSHLAGALGAAVLDRIFELKWARREPCSRVVAFTPPGRRAFEKMLAG
jgi:DNA-binding transcriptional ArsR family regulator